MQQGSLFRSGRKRGPDVWQVALAWLLQRSPDILDIPGTSSSSIFASIFRRRCFRFP
jgi:aryl-alcohol dehydrogenase-like predicted oxidoreductase